MADASHPVTPLDLEPIKARHADRLKPLVGRCGNGHEEEMPTYRGSIPSSVAADLGKCSICGLPLMFTLFTSTSMGDTPDDDIAELLAEVERLRAAASSGDAGAPPQWQRIETAPSDGWFLVCDGKRMMVAAGDVLHLSRRAGTPFHLSGNHWTHWMPLPEAPHV